MEFAPFDSRHYETRPVADGYREWSETYDAAMGPELDLALAAALSEDDLAWPEIRAACDLACGTGRIGAWLKARGVATVDGADVTPEMLRRAEEKGVYRKLACADMTATPFPGGAYDLITSVLAVEHVSDLGAFYREASRLAKPVDARFIVVGYHPHFLLRGIPTHFRNASGENVAIENHVHLFRDHFRAARAHGWAPATLDESVVDEAWVARSPRWERHFMRPASFLILWRRARRDSASHP